MEIPKLIVSVVVVFFLMASGSCSFVAPDWAARGGFELCFRVAILIPEFPGNSSLLALNYSLLCPSPTMSCLLSQSHVY